MWKKARLQSHYLSTSPCFKPVSGVIFDLHNSNFSVDSICLHVIHFSQCLHHWMHSHMVSRFFVQPFKLYLRCFFCWRDNVCNVPMRFTSYPIPPGLQGQPCCHPWLQGRPEIQWSDQKRSSKIIQSSSVSSRALRMFQYVRISCLVYKFVRWTAIIFCMEARCW